MSWNTIESDPGVFTELISSFGVKSPIEAEEIWSMDAQFPTLGKIYGLIFLFKYQQGAADDRETVDASTEPDLFFAHQTIQNACATQAILQILLNRPDVDVGETLSGFRSFTREFDASLKGEAIGNSDPIRTAHNSFARAEPFQITEEKAGKDDDVFHFIEYVPFNGKVYELDGLKPGPIVVGAADGDEWLGVAQQAVGARFERYVKRALLLLLLLLLLLRPSCCCCCCYYVRAAAAAAAATPEVLLPLLLLLLRPRCCCCCCLPEVLLLLLLLVLLPLPMCCFCCCCYYARSRAAAAAAAAAARFS